MRPPALSALVVLMVAAAMTACQPAERGQDEAGAEEAEPGVVDVTASDFEFELPEAIPSGWTTFRFHNESDEQEHFFVLWGLPEGKTFADYRAEVFQPYMDVWSRYDAAELTRQEATAELGKELPAWFLEDVEAAGGAALTEPGRTSRVTVQLAPGTYAMECYVKTPQGTWHNDRGMLRELTVTADSTGLRPPEPDVEITLSNYEIAAPDRLDPGPHTVAVHVTETPDALLPHDVNLFRLEGDTTTVEEIAGWLDWMDLEQFRAPAPGVSMGGVEHLPAGRTGYMTVDLEPGRYAWVSEGYADRGMVHPFRVE